MQTFPPAMPLFDAVQHLEDGNPTVNQYLANVTLRRVHDAAFVYELAVDWLLEQRHSENNFKTYRSELTTFLFWAFEIEEVSVADITRRALSRYIEFCLKPPQTLIAYRNVAQFVLSKEIAERVPNPIWRPFLGKKREGIELPYTISDKALKIKLSILSSFYSFLINEEYTERNPAMALMNNGRFKSLSQNLKMTNDDESVKAFTELQWSYVVSTAQRLADESPEQHERTLFLISLMYACYLRISEVAARPGFSPVMGQFRRDSKTGVWGFYLPLSKGGKKRTVAVSNQLLESLKRYRTHLGIRPLPVPSEDTPLFIRHQAAGRGRDAGLVNANLGIRQIRESIDRVIQQAADNAEQDGFHQDAQEMRQMTPHSIRHTGISHDINLNNRPLSHVQADAGHDSIDTTSQYLHTTRVERHESAAHKPLDHLAISYRRNAPESEDR
ncbi:Site-specific recombinase, phage integrase family [Marinobacterium lacunae]|uniref:Site-specific recombinase, phage integrase family n=1 Tax=Marinobacterium lacunae TaxID=1232683 RepID=A0A081FTK5_9GAMM|nr:site-specific integrase [Marinobacterium lacunae]KEA61860.1 Site-specific recombinase, phage integrase family [Marinobacterium lacunae]